MANEKSIMRANELNEIAIKNNEQKSTVLSGLSEEVVVKTQKNKERLLEYFNATNEDWDSYKWQMTHRITDVVTLNKIFPLSEKRYKEIEKVSITNLWSIAPYYASLVDYGNDSDPIGFICLPNIAELEEGGELDPMSEEFTNPADSITRRYPDRLIVYSTNSCGMYCRFCQRKRKFDSDESLQLKDDLKEAIDYIKNTPTIRDVLITGGDPLTLSTPALEKIIAQIRAIEHVEIIRIGTRVPVSIPQRVDKELTDMLKKYHPLFINTHFNHPREITQTSVNACNMLADAGIPLGNQSVLLKGVNNSKYTFLKLNHELLKARVRPYYIFQAKKVLGTTHFICDINEGLEIVDFLRGNTSGLAIPTYIVNAPNGNGKVPLNKLKYEINENGDFIINTWEGKKIEYKNS